MRRIIRLAALSAFLFMGYVGQSQTVIISKVYGGGGNSGATFRNDFIELHNPTGSPVSLVGYSVQYASSAGTTWAGINLSSTINPYGYYLIQGASGGAVGAFLPTPDASGSINMSATVGKVALVSSTTLLSGACPSATVVDMVGYGVTPSCFEGAGAAPAPSNTTAVERKFPCVDSNNNNNDFRAATPNPLNTASPAGYSISFTSSYPKIQSITSTGFQAITNLDNLGTTYFVIQMSGLAAPSSTQVKNGQNGLGATLTADFKGTISVTSAATEFTASPTNLVSSTAYDVYFVAERCTALTSTVMVPATTLSASDVTPPNYISGYPKAQSVSSTGFQAATKLDEGGKTYFVVLSSGAGAPSTTQVKAGQDGSGTPLSSNLKGQITVANPNTEYTTNVTGLSASTNYSVYFVSEDIVPNLQASVAQVDISTTAPPVVFTENFNNCDGTSSFSSYSVTGDQVWGCVDFGYNSTKGLRMNGFLGSALDNEDWLISPPLVLSANANLSFYSQFSFAGPALQLKISTDYTGAGNPNSATWTTLNGNFPVASVGSSSTALSDWTLSNVDLSAYTGNVFLAFIYASTVGTNTAARWTLDEINVSGGVASYQSVTPSGLLFGASGVVKSYVLRGTNLQNDVNITAPSNFSVSKDNSTFGSSISYTAAEANAQQTVYVKFDAASSVSIFTGNISHTSTGVAPRSVSVKGTDKSLTLDIATYNLEFFGTDVHDTGGSEFGPIDDALQVTNVTTVMQNLEADIIGVEEVSDDNAFNTLVSNLPGYDKILSNRWSYSFDPPDPNFPPQKIGFIYKTSTVQLVSSRVMFLSLYNAIKLGTATLANYPGGTSSSFWSSGRLPFMVTFDVTINGVKRRIRVIDIHAKSGGSDPADYNRRKYDVKVLYDSLKANYSQDNIVLLGDFNDDVDVSIYTSSLSPYKDFVDDAASFSALTYAISVNGASSFPSSSSLIDHIVVSNELSSPYISNSITVEDPRSYISNYLNTTSDHLPVTARFLLTGKADQYITFAQPPDRIFAYPPFNLTANAYSGLPVTFASSDPLTASISGNTVTILKAGSVNITASQVGDSFYNSAPDIIQPLTIAKGSQTILFSTPSTKTFGDPAFSLTATSSSLLPVSFVSSDPLVASITGNTVTILKPGTINITASQPGNGNYNAAVDDIKSLVINKANQTITFNAIPTKTVGDAAFSVTATASSTLAVSFGTTSDKVTLNANQVTIVKAGRAIITASQAGNATFAAATSVDQSFCIKPTKPTVTLSNANTATPVLTSSNASGNQWYLNGTAITGATNATFTVATAGVYKVQAKADDCASDFSADMPIIFTGDIQNPISRIIVYPNPVDNYLEVRGLTGEMSGSHVFDMMGRMSNVVFENRNEAYRASVEHLLPGVYLLRIQEGAGVHQIKFIKK